MYTIEMYCRRRIIVENCFNYRCEIKHYKNTINIYFVPNQSQFLERKSGKIYKIQGLTKCKFESSTFSTSMF